MQPYKYLSDWLTEHADEKHYLFAHQDLRPLLYWLSDSAYRVLLSRAVNAGLLSRVCRGMYFVERVQPADGLLLYHVAARLRAKELNYISLETALSATGIISQVPMNWISIMSSGRSSVISCHEFGTIEFVHTNQDAHDLHGRIQYDHQCGLWRASVSLALRDMKATHRNCDLIDWELANEFI